MRTPDATAAVASIWGAIVGSVSTVTSSEPTMSTAFGWAPSGGDSEAVRPVVAASSAVGGFGRQGGEVVAQGAPLFGAFE